MYSFDDVKKVQNRLLDMAITIRDILDNHSISYFICAGTLLGAIRNKGFIPWDDDFDMYIFDDQYQDAMIALREGLPPDMFLEDDESEPMYFHAWAHVKDVNTVCHCAQFPQDSLYEHKGISVDLYRYCLMKQKEWPQFKFTSAMRYLDERLHHGFIAREDYEVRKQIEIGRIGDRERLVNMPDALVFGSANSKYMMRFECILPLSTVTFEGYEFNAPNKPDEFLTKVYNNYLELPPLGQRRPHYSSVVFMA